MNPHTGHHPNWSPLTIALANWSSLWDAFDCCKAIVCHFVLSHVLYQHSDDDDSFVAFHVLVHVHVHVASVVHVALDAAAPADKHRTFHFHFHLIAGHALNDSRFLVIVKRQVRDRVWVLMMILWSRWTGAFGCFHCHLLLLNWKIFQRLRC